MRRGSRRQAFFLLETMGWIAGLLAAMALGGAVLISALRTQELAASAHQRLIHLADLAEEFRTDVASSVAVVDSLKLGNEEIVASSSCLMLRRSDHHVLIYRWIKGKLERIEQGGPKLVTRIVPLDAEVKWLEFISAGGDKPLLTLRLRIQPNKTSPNRQMDVQAVLGGDL
jgi:hypothetical protein